MMPKEHKILYTAGTKGKIEFTITSTSLMIHKYVVHNNIVDYSQVVFSSRLSRKCVYTLTLPLLQICINNTWHLSVLLMLLLSPTCAKSSFT